MAPDVISNNTINPFPNNGRFYSRWAEITYFLFPNGDTIQPAGTPLYSLRRRERLLAPGADFPPITVPDANAFMAQYPNLALIATSPTTVTLIGSETIARRNRRFTHLGTNGATMFDVPAPTPLTGSQFGGDDILLPDVISFEVKLTWLNDTSIWGAYSPSLTSFVPVTQTDYPFSDLPLTALNANLAGQRIFDTFYRASDLELGATTFGNEGVNWEDRTAMTTPTNGQPPVRINVRGVQIKLRVWDYKAKTARQMTFMVDQ
jgi:hypothetical protein